jgi:hypothetical protein
MDFSKKTSVRHSGCLAVVIVVMTNVYFSCRQHLVSFNQHTHMKTNNECSILNIMYLLYGWNIK